MVVLVIRYNRTDRDPSIVAASIRRVISITDVNTPHPGCHPSISTSRLSVLSTSLSELNSMLAGSACAVLVLVLTLWTPVSP